MIWYPEQSIENVEQIKAIKTLESAKLLIKNYPYFFEKKRKFHSKILKRNLEKIIIFSDEIR